VFALLSLALAGIGACSKFAAQTGAAPALVPPPVPVTVATAEQRDVPVQLRAIARVEAYQTVTIKPQVAGQVSALHFEQGQDVKAGDLLFSLDPRPFEAALRQAEANLAKDTVLAEDVQREAKFTGDLVKQTAAAQREYEKAQAAADALAATVRADQALVDNARINLDYCSIRSPLDGRTGARLADPGNVVKANEAELVVINQINPIYVTFSVPEQYLSEIKKFQADGPLAVAAVFPQDDATIEQGTLSFIDNRIDNTTGMVTLKGTFPNESRRLWPGQFVNVILTLTTRPGAVVIPSQAVQTGQAGQFVYVVKDDSTVESRPVTTGPTLTTLVVIERGVDAGQRVVTDGQLRLVPGAKISIKDGSPASQETHR
jgi:multidrug efflux system membrane fusion protein